MMTAAGHQCSCCSGPVSSVHQTLDEMDFERGLLDFNRSDIVIDFLYLKPSPPPWGVCACVLVCTSAGIWSAALHGDLQKVQSLVQKGTHPNQRDTAGYTALVCVCVHGYRIFSGF